MERYNEVNKILINLLNGHQEISNKIIYLLMKNEFYGRYMINNQIKCLYEEYNWLSSREGERLSSWPTTKTPLYKMPINATKSIDNSKGKKCYKTQD